MGIIGKVNIGPTSPWVVQSKVASSTNGPAHSNAPKAPVKVGHQLSQPDAYGRAMNSAMRNTQVYGAPGK